MFKTLTTPHTYIIDGDLSLFTRFDMDKKRMWDLTSSFKINNRLALKEQHGDKELLNGPLHLDCTFFIRFRGSVCKSVEYHNKPHAQNPRLSALMILLEAVGTGVLFEHASSIVSVDARKYYDSERPRVEFKLFETKRDME